MKYPIVLMLIYIPVTCLSLISQPIELKNPADVSTYNQISGRNLSSNSIQEISGSFTSELSERITNEGSLIKIKGAGFRFETGSPIIPQKNIHFKLKGYYHINDVSIRSGTVKKGKTKYLIRPQSRRIRKNRILNIQSKTTDNIFKVYYKNAFFPAKWLTFTAGYDGKFTHIYIHLFPLQWNPNTYDLLFLEEYTISIRGTEIFDDIQKAILIPVNDKHLILSPSAWLSTADSIAQFHNAQGISTAVLNVEHIYQAYTAVENPSHPGYANMTNTNIHNYNYNNTKKIIAYLRDIYAHPDAELITILGAGEIIPASYYFYIPVDVVPSQAIYFSWIPSDHYYASPDYDWIDNFAVNRVSVHTKSELKAYYHKMLNWNNQLQGTWVNNVSLSGGIPCETNYFLGELGNNHIICSNICCGFNIQKFQHHLGTYNATNMRNHLINDDFLFHYNDSHGSGRAIYFDDHSDIGVTDIISFPSKTRLPVFLSLACMNGNFDTQCVTNPWGAGMSFAESMIISPGGSIAFVGGARYTTGDVLTELDNGNIRCLGQNQLYALLFHYMKAYRQVSVPYLGKLFKAAKDSFLLEQDMNDDEARIAYVQFQAFCDAALQLPIPPEVNPLTTVPTVSVSGALTYPNNDFQIVNLNSNEHPQYNINGGNQYDLMTINISEGTIKQFFNVGHNFTVYYLRSNQLVLNKVINAEGKEAWHYSIVNKGFKKVDADLSDWFPEEQVDADDVGEITPDHFDLSTIYAAFDSTNNAFYFALSINPAPPEENIYYIIAIDDQPSFGFQNNYLSDDIFPFPIYLGFEDATINKLIVFQTDPSDYFESPYEISKYKYYEYTLNQGIAYWIDYPIDIGNIGGVAFSSSNSFEITVPARTFNTSNCKMAIFSSIDEGIMEDVIPSSPQSPSTVLYGIDNAYSVSTYLNLEDMIRGNENLISNYYLYQNYPNPFNPNTTIEFDLSNSSDVTLKIFNVLGEEVAMLVSDRLSAGSYTYEWNASNMASGVYLYRLETDNYVETRKMILMH